MTQIRRALDWIPVAFDARDARPTPQDYFPALSPVFDTFGTSRAGEMLSVGVSGVLGALEIFDGPVPLNTVRHYLSVEYWHDDVVNRLLAPARLIRGGGGVIINRIRDEISVPADQRLAITRTTVGPNDFLAVETRAIAVGARLFLRATFIDTPIGESTDRIL